LVSGAVLTLGVTAVGAGVGVLAAVLAAALGPARLVLEAAALKFTVSPRGLVAAARSVERARAVFLSTMRVSAPYSDR
jgi:cobalamin biosynthesis protein CobD/CbiB